MKPVIDYDKCTVCGTCVSVCPVEVFEKKDDKVVVSKPDACIECRACENSCPTEAITLVD